MPTLPAIALVIAVGLKVVMIDLSAESLNNSLCRWDELDLLSLLPLVPSAGITRCLNHMQGGSSFFSVPQESTHITHSSGLCPASHPGSQLSS